MDLLTIAILLFVVGVLLGIAEVFIPSGGILAILSASAFVGAAVCAFKVSAGWGITFVLGTPVVMLVVLVKGFKVFPRTPIGRRMILARPVGAEQADGAAPKADPGADPDLAGLVGQVGVARTELRPAGSADFGRRKCNVVSDGDFIAEGTLVRVVEVRGNRVVVEAETDSSDTQV